VCCQINVFNADDTVAQISRSLRVATSLSASPIGGSRLLRRSRIRVMACEFKPRCASVYLLHAAPALCRTPSGVAAYDVFKTLSTESQLFSSPTPKASRPHHIYTAIRFRMPAFTMALRLLRLFPVLSSTVTLMFAVDEHIFLGTWTRPSIRDRANVHLPAWFQLWGRRGRWIILLGYPANYLSALFNLALARHELYAAGAANWYLLGLLFSLGHIAIYAKGALKLLADIRNDVPRGNSTHTMEAWLKMHWVRSLTTDLPAWICFIVAALKVL
jgi:hypothetical protein